MYFRSIILSLFILFNFSNLTLSAVANTEIKKVKARYSFKKGKKNQEAREKLIQFK